jgi:hypothetical protein
MFHKKPPINHIRSGPECVSGDCFLSIPVKKEKGVISGFKYTFPTI